MRIITAVLFLCTALPAVAGRGEPAPRELTRPDVEAWVDGFLPYALADGDIAGGAVVIVKDGGVLALRGYGYADVAKRIPVDPARTLFRTGSVGKLFTWTAVMQEVEAGRIDLDHDVNNYLDFRIPPRGGEPITLRNLMTHTPGFEEPVKRLVTDRPDRIVTPEQFVKAWIPDRIFAPGEIPAYSNYGVTLAGYLLERVSGESYDDYVDRHVFAPLGMTRSTTRQPLPAALRGQVSQGYLESSGRAYPFELFGVAPAGAATTTAADMGRFMLAWLQGGALGGARIMKPETVRQALETKLPIVPPLNGMLLGFFEQDLNGRRIAGHRGDSQYFHCTLNLFPDDGVGVYLVVNSTGRHGASEHVITGFVNAFVDRYFAAPAIESTVGAADAARHARQMVGSYMSSRRQESNFMSLLSFLSQVNVTLDEQGGLRVPALLDPNGEPMRWREVRPFVWRQVGGKERLAARVDDGRIELWAVDSSSPFLVMQPVPWWKSSAVVAPLLAGALAALLVALAAWPVTALMRRHYRLWPTHAGPRERSWRWTRILAAGVLAAGAGWSALLAQLEGNLFAFSPALDPWIALLKVATAVSCAGGTAAAVWDARRGWPGRRWPSRFASLLLVAAFALLLWTAAILRLAGYGTDY
jgi:CubicO group peptidase (beta-lactamase class C family)